MAQSFDQTERQFRLLVDGVVDYAIFMLDPEGRVVTWNQGAERIKGYSAEEILGQNFSIFYTQEASEAGHPRHELELARAKGRYEEEGWRVRKDGSQFWANVVITAVLDDRGEVLGFSKVTRDATERRNAELTIGSLNEDLERRVQARTADLREALEELEAFIYSVSHDLRGPLRGIDGFSKLLLDDYGDQLDAEGQRLLNVIRSNTSSMAQLIEDLLSLSLVGRRELELRAIDMEALATVAAGDLEAEYGQRDVRITVGALPEAWGDRGLIRQVLANLISNAIKFTRLRAVATVEVGADVDAGEQAFWVRDNGVGFDMRYHDKMFGVFQRLQPSEFEGTGVGLALVQRIVRRHGGRVWAVGEPDAGATFFFSLPSVKE